MSACPSRLFYNTGIGTYVWVVTNRKAPERRGKIQLIDARERWKPMRRSLGDKRCELGEDDICAIVREYGDFCETKTSEIFDNADFGYNRVPIERPLRLLYAMDVERKSRILEAVPHLLDDVQAIDRELGRTPRTDWSKFDALMSIFSSGVAANGEHRSASSSAMFSPSANRRHSRSSKNSAKPAATPTPASGASFLNRRDG